MGVSISTNTEGISNINSFVSQKVGSDKFATLAGLFANVNLDGAPILRGIFTETNIHDNVLSVSYAQVGRSGVNLHAGMRVNLYKDEWDSFDITMYGNKIILLNGHFSITRFGANYSWTTHPGHMVTLGASLSQPIDSTTLEAGVKINVWKSETRKSSFDITFNITQFMRGPLGGSQYAVAGLMFSHSL